MSRVFLILPLILCGLSDAFSAVRFPNNLNEKDREQVTRLLGWGTAGKLLSDPYPLGGYSGLEIGLSVESVPIDDLSRLGNKNIEPQENLTYPKLSVGKGLYNNLDTWIHFIPYSESTGLSEFGGMARWCFFQATFFPGTVSVLLHGNSTNISNSFSSQSYGGDLVTGINIGQVGLYLGGGKIATTSRFLGGVTGFTDSLKDETATVEGFHSMIGGSIRMQSLFMALQIDLYSNPVFSSKFGLKF